MSGREKSRTGEERAHSERLDQQYLQRQSPVFLEIEREVFGTDYGATSWTDREEAQRFASWLGLGPGVQALELGAGSGWPGLYLARLTGCGVTLADLPPEGLRIASARAASEGLADRCPAVVSDGARLPFAGARFEAVLHCDVLC
jgi:SAM-dependent methyltransferase